MEGGTTKAGTGSPTTDQTQPAAEDPATALGGAGGDGADNGHALGPAKAADGLPPSNGSPQKSPSAGPLGTSGGTVPSIPLITAPQLSPTLRPLPVGGVLLDRAATTGFDLREVGFEDGELILVGSHPGDPEIIARLGEDLSDAILVAAKSEWLGQHLWISIDPPARYRSAQTKLPPQGTPMCVSYGGCAGTATGKSLLLNDLLLKHLTTGRHHATGALIRPTRDFVPLVDLMDPRDSGSNCWQRFWFVVDQVRLASSSNFFSVQGSEIRIEARTETENNGGEQDPVALKFTDYINRNYETLAAQAFPELRDLKFRALASGLASWLVAQSKLPASIVFNYTPRPVPTPAMIPGSIVEGGRVHTESTLQGKITRRFMLFGGVDVRPKLFVETGRCPSLLGPAMEARRGPGPAWDFRHRGQPLSAVAIPLGRKAESGDEPRLDIHHPSTKHDSVKTRAERRQAATDPVLALHVNGDAILYRRTPSQDRLGKTAFCRVLSQGRNDDGGLSFRVAPEDVLHEGWLGGYTRTVSGRSTIHFDSNGRLRR